MGEFKGWMGVGYVGEDEFHVGGDEEAEQEEGDDYEVDQADADSRDCYWRICSEHISHSESVVRVCRTHQTVGG
jgi:hypothetical protein